MSTDKDAMRRMNAMVASLNALNTKMKDNGLFPHLVTVVEHQMSKQSAQIAMRMSERLVNITRMGCAEAEDALKAAIAGLEGEVDLLITMSTINPAVTSEEG